jgi:hypothetical protein
MTMNLLSGFPYWLLKALAAPHLDRARKVIPAEEQALGWMDVVSGE